MECCLFLINFKRGVNHMKACVVKRQGVLSVEDVPSPQAGSSEAVIKVAYCGICGSDVRLLAEGFYPPGMIPGHEFSGTICEIGPATDGWNIGERVTANPGVRCKTCYYCLRGDWHHCPNQKTLGLYGDLQGAFAEYVKVGVDSLHRIPPEVTDQEAACVEPCAVSLRAVRLSGLQVGDTVAIFGAGAIGLFTVQLTRSAGAKAVYVVEPSEKRRRAAAVLGADCVIDPAQTASVVAELQNHTGAGADVAYVCTAAPSVLQQAVDAVRPRGKVMEIGGGGTATVIPELWMWKEVQVCGSYSYVDEFGLAIELFRQRKVTIDSVVSNRIPLARAPQAFQELATPNSEIKVLVQLA
jgi:(R,R)-butanediol dehydrogenase/meso-butanediol dehydrogenase/diacetyl reductase